MSNRYHHISIANWYLWDIEKGKKLTVIFYNILIMPIHLREFVHVFETVVSHLKGGCFKGNNLLSAIVSSKSYPIWDTRILLSSLLNESPLEKKIAYISSLNWTSTSNRCCRFYRIPIYSSFHELWVFFVHLATSVAVDDIIRYVVLHKNFKILISCHMPVICSIPSRASPFGQPRDTKKYEDLCLRFMSRWQLEHMKRGQSSAREINQFWKYLSSILMDGVQYVRFL